MSAAIVYVYFLHPGWLGDREADTGRANTLSLHRLQLKKVEVTAEALAKGSDPSLPPLMNPTILEASDDLTNLSHLNEPAGTFLLCSIFLSIHCCVGG